MTTCYHLEHKLAYIHIPKCAGSSVGGQVYYPGGEWRDCWLNDVLPGWTREGLPNGHQPVRALEQWTGKPIEWWDRIIVTLRNPFAQQVSQYEFWRNRGRKQAQQGLGSHEDDIFASAVSFSRFVECPRSCGPNALCGLDPVSARDGALEAGGYYKWYIMDDDGQIPPNVRIVKTEDLAAGMQGALSSLGAEFKEIPRENTISHAPWQEYYDLETAQVVANKFGWSLATHYPDLTSLEWLGTNQEAEATEVAAAI